MFYATKEEALKALGSGANFGMDELAEKLVYVSGAGTPSATSTVPAFIGQAYFDTSNADFYIGTGTSAAADFKQITA